MHFQVDVLASFGGAAVGHFRSLARFEVERAKTLRELAHAVRVETDHAGEGRRRARQALERDVDARAIAGGALLHDVGEDAEPRRERQTGHDVVK